MTGGFVDLHAHSTASDGAASPEDAVESASRAGLSAFALTDHDSLAGIPAAREAGKRLGLRIIAGVELSVMDDDREVHLLGLHVHDAVGLEDRLVSVRDGRRRRAIAIVARLNDIGVPVTFSSVLAESAGGAIGRPHVARALIGGGWVRDLREAFDRYLGAGRPANVEKERVTFADGAALIHEHGGLAVFAHPGPDGTRARLQSLAAKGLDGVEVLHPGHSPDDVQRLRTLTDELDLVPSGGSDWHGASAGTRVLGAMHVPGEWLDRHDRRLAARQAAHAQ